MNEKIVNALYAQAVCDAVGDPFEFKSRIKPERVVDYAKSTPFLEITDDTQMALAGFFAMKNINFAEKDTLEKQVKEKFTEEYLKWFYTQEKPLFYSNQGYTSFPSVYKIKSPGLTCLSSLRNLDVGVVRKNDSMGCGSVMRLLPILLLESHVDIDTLIKLAKITGNITHNHQESDAAIKKFIRFAADLMNDRVVSNPFPHVVKISEIGKGWIAPECVNMAIWSYCTAKDFDDLLGRSIAHKGDSDSVAALAGALWGLSGKPVPQEYIGKLDSLEIILHIVNE